MNEPIGFNLTTGLLGAAAVLAWELVVKPWLSKRKPTPAPEPQPGPEPVQPQPSILDILDLLKEILKRVRELGPEVNGNGKEKP
jgi:hypothetical protein